MGVGDGDRAKLPRGRLKLGPSLSAQTRPLLGGMRPLGQSAAPAVRFLLVARVEYLKFILPVARLKGSFPGVPNVLPSLIAIADEVIE
jgi:hypothetical protein